MSHMQSIVELGSKVLIGNYARLPVSMSHGEGSILFDADGKQYIDLFAGFGGAILGHCHPALIEAATEQTRRLWHVGNTFYTEPQIQLAERLNQTAFEGKAFFCHSGLEANEAAIKLARLRGTQNGGKRWKIVSLHQSFHGRSLAMISATGNPAVKAGFGPNVPGFSQVDLGDVEALLAAVDDETAGIIVEPIQGEGGIHPLGVDYARELRRLCDARQLTLIFDEVWTGCGRTGKWFGYHNMVDADGHAIVPDIMTLGKAIGGGLPVGVMYARPALAAMLVPGRHGCTLGGNPICMAVARSIFDVIAADDLLNHAANTGGAAMHRLRREPRIAGKIKEVRGQGLFIGIELEDEPIRLIERALARGLIINLTSKKVIRLAPPINIPAPVWEQGLALLVETIAE